MKLKQIPEDFIVKEILELDLKAGGEYAYYELKKKGLTLHTVIAKIARLLKVKERTINYAGIKDKEAITTQTISIRDGPEKDLEGSDYSLTQKGHGKERINLGALEGNAFEITIRDINAAPRLQKQFLNSFGEQRFGMNKNNHEIGRLIVKGDFEEAAKRMAEQHQECKEFLAAHPENHIGAIREIDKKLGLLYIHAYQSWLWNEAAELLNKSGHDQCDLPLLGFGTDFDDEPIRKVYEKIMKKEDLRLQDFIIRKMPEFSAEGNVRALYIEPEGFTVGELEDDELNKGKKKVRISFSLPKGSYATEIIGQCLWV